jgi:6-phospho-beta-glucosidase
VAIGFQRAFARRLGVAPERVVVDQVGLNHLTWIRGVRLDGADVLADLLATHGDEIAADVSLPRWVVDELGVIPSYYLHYFYGHDEVLEAQRSERPRAAVVADIEAGLLELYRDPNLNEKPALLERRGGAFYSEAATGLVTSLVAGSGEVHVVDVRNEGTLAGLQDDDVVEVPARVRPGRIEPLPQAPLAPELLGLAQHVAAYERLAVRAATSGDPALVRRALLAHPLVGQHAMADELTRLLLEAGAEHLPWGRAGARA